MIMKEGAAVLSLIAVYKTFNEWITWNYVREASGGGFLMLWDSFHSQTFDHEDWSCGKL